jgi:hypothetical protein
VNQPALSTKQAVATAASFPRSNHRDTKTFSQGFVRLVGPNEPVGFKTKEKQFFGLLAPGNSVTNGNLITRALVPAEKSPGWFKEFIENLTDTNIEFRVSLIGISYKAPIAFFIPKAANLRQLNVENKRRLDGTVNSTKYAINEYPDDVTLGNFIHDEYAKGIGARIVSRENGKHGVTAIAIKTNGDIIRLSGGDAVWNFTDGIAKKVTTLEAEMALAVKAETLRFI